MGVTLQQKLRAIITTTIMDQHYGGTYCAILNEETCTMNSLSSCVGGGVLWRD